MVPSEQFLSFVVFLENVNRTFSDQEIKVFEKQMNNTNERKLRREDKKKEVGKKGRREKRS